MHKEYVQTADRVLSDLQSGPEGLSAAQAEGRLAEYGPNRLREAPKATLLQRFLQQLRDPMLLILMAAAAVSAVTNYLSHEPFTEVLIILAVVLLFWKKMWPFQRPDKAQGKSILKTDIFVTWLKVVVACIPGTIATLLFGDFIDEHLETPIVIAIMLIFYGAAFIIIEQINKHRTPRVTTLGGITFLDAFLIGLFQVLSIIPGTSRSGATIVGGLLLGLSRACVAEFTFYLAIPVMAGASLLKVVKFVLGGSVMTGTEIAVLVVGCVVAFGVSLAVIRFLMDYVKRHDFKSFGAYRIVLGIIVLAVAAVTAIV